LRADHGLYLFSGLEELLRVLEDLVADCYRHARNVADRAARRCLSPGGVVAR
jgi:hypothetical protein